MVKSSASIPPTNPRKEHRFNHVLVAAKQALDSIGVRFHLHSGTALGAYRNHTFIPHDHDIDLGVFYWDAPTIQRVHQIRTSMKIHGFTETDKIGSLRKGLELQFEMKGIPLDLFWIYPGNYRGKKYYILSSYFGVCDTYKNKRCVWGYRPYHVRTIQFLGHEYRIVPKKTLIDMYGKDWNITKKYGYHEGIIQQHYKGLLRDYAQPRADERHIAFCFLLYDQVKHSQIWTRFFSGDNYPLPSYSIYTHLKEVTANTQDWVQQHKIPAIKTEWCGENLVWAWIRLLEHALEDPKNEYFCLLSGECIPLFTYDKLRHKILSSHKSRLHIDRDSYNEGGLVYADQWMILTRKHARELIHLKTTEKGQAWTDRTATIDFYNCPDELYPLNWFRYIYGPISSASFRREFSVYQPVTYTDWSGGKTSPSKLNSTQVAALKKKICSSGALFARKFFRRSADQIAMQC